jgi:Ca-activated chloride channel family protein
MSTNDFDSNSNAETSPRSAASRIALGIALLSVTLVGGWAVGAVGKGGPSPGTGADGGIFHGGDSGAIHFQGRLDRGTVLQNSDGSVGMELVLSADELTNSTSARVPTDLVVVLDRSGSMQGKPLADARASVRELIQRLGADDRFALVTYSSGVELAIPLQDASAQNRRRWIEAVNGISSGGGTNMASGIDLASDTVARARQAGRMPRVILLSDGHANQGDHSAEGLRARAGRAVVGEYVLSTVGVGSGFDEALMTTLADAGTGNFYYVRDGSDLGDVFAGEFESARDTVASAVTVEIDLGPGVEILESAGYPLERAGRTVRFRPGTLFAGQERRIWLGLRAPTNQVGDIELGEFRLSYREPDAALGSEPQVLRFDEPLRMACVADETSFVASLEPDLMMRSIVEEKLSTLKQGVAASLRKGDHKDAKQKIEAYKKRNRDDYDRLGIVQEETDSFREAESLGESVARAFLAPQSAPARNALSKTLAAEGQDGRRQGAKK